MPSHPWADVKLFSILSFQHYCPISVPFSGDYFSLADFASGKEFLIFNPIFSIIPFILLVAPRRILPLLGGLLQGISDHSWSCLIIRAQLISTCSICASKQGEGPEWIHSALNHFPELSPALFHCIWCLSCKTEIPNCCCRMDIPLNREKGSCNNNISSNNDKWK